MTYGPLAVPGVRAGFVSRLVAFGIDLAVVNLVGAIVTDGLATAWTLFGLHAFLWGRRALILVDLGAVALVTFCMFPLAWSLTGASLGKALLGLRVVSHDGAHMTLARSLLRLAGYWVSALPLFAGFAASLVDARGRAWHDRLARTAVVYAETTADALPLTGSASRRSLSSSLRRRRSS
ncbi:MAG TPA: RDD family protein [Polyangiaceae bacterium]|nr:RDD family protein [Polyangiaceae bacterium]